MGVHHVDHVDVVHVQAGGVDLADEVAGGIGLLHHDLVVDVLDVVDGDGGLEPVAAQLAHVERRSCRTSSWVRRAWLSGGRWSAT